MRALAFAALLSAGCSSLMVCHFGPVHRPATSPRSLCAALAADDYARASAAITTKLATIGGVGNQASADLVRAWLFTQPCVVAIERTPCQLTMHPEIDMHVRSGRVRVVLSAAGGVLVTQGQKCASASGSQ